MEDLYSTSGLQLYSTSGQKANSKSSGGRETDFDDSDFILRPSGDNNVVPDLRVFIKLRDSLPVRVGINCAVCAQR